MVEFLRSTFSFAKYCMRKSTYFVTPGVAPTVQALHLFKLFMMLRTTKIIKKIFKSHLKVNQILNKWQITTVPSLQ